VPQYKRPHVRNLTYERISTVATIAGEQFHGTSLFFDHNNANEKHITTGVPEM
jgi:hypothetical protein